MVLRWIYVILNNIHSFIEFANDCKYEYNKRWQQ